jgi:dTDP-glucose 4,6-dehydratase
VTGGAVFIGSALSLYLARSEAAYDVTVVDCLTYAANPDSLRPLRDHPGFRLIRQDVRDTSAMHDLVAAVQPDAILHLAAETHVDRSIARALPFVETNIVGTYSVLEATRAYWGSLAPAEAERFRFIQMSTDEVYGTLGAEGTFAEDSRYDPSSPYSASKASADFLVQAWQRTYGLPAIIANCSNNFGPRQFPEKLIPLTILNALEGLAIPVYGDGLNVRDWLYVEDHVRALEAIMLQGRPGERYAIGARSERPNLVVVEQICDLLDSIAPAGSARRGLISFVEDRAGHDRRYAINPKKTETELGWRPVETFETALAKTVNWYVDNEDWWRPLR